MLGTLEVKVYFCPQSFFMKRIIIFLFVAILGYTAEAQRFNTYTNEWKISVGLNAVGSLGTRNPVAKLDEFAFRFPIIVAGEYQWTEHFAVEQNISLNGFKKGKVFDKGRVSDKDLTYFSTDTSLKWYFSSYLYDYEELELYLSAGVGIFHMDELNTSANLTGGVQYWFDDNLGVRFQATGKFATSPKDHMFSNNHFQHALQVVYRF